jgi:hypothetical protein
MKTEKERPWMWASQRQTFFWSAVHRGINMLIDNYGNRIELSLNISNECCDYKPLVRIEVKLRDGQMNRETCTRLDEWFLTIDGMDEAISDKFDELDDEIYGWINED